MVAKCHLEFDGFDGFLIKALRKVYEANLFPDVTLVGDDECQIEGHRIILSAHSSVLEKAILESQSNKPTLRLKGFSYQDLSSLMQYLYLGEVSLPFGQASELLKMAKFLQIYQLGSECNVPDMILNRMFSIAEDDFVSIDGYELKAEDAIPVDDGNTRKEVTMTESSEVVTMRKKEYDDETFLDETYQSYYKNIESEIDDFEECEFESSDADKENNKKIPLESDRIQEDQKKRKEKRKFVYSGEGDNIEEPDYGADMVGKLLPSYSVSQSVIYSRYYFVRSKPINGIVWARCNLCWYKIGTGVAGQIKKFIKVSSKVPTTTTTMIAHINKMHPVFMDQLMRQQEEASKALQILREKMKIAKLEQREEKLRRKRFKEEMDKIKVKRGKHQKTFNRIDRLSAKEPNYDFEHLDEDILTTEVGAPRENHSPRDSIVYSHNFFRKLHPIRNQSQTSLKSSYAECITCAQRYQRNILTLTESTTTPMFTHIRIKHPELTSKLQKLLIEKKYSLHNKTFKK